MYLLHILYYIIMKENLLNECISLNNQKSYKNKRLCFIIFIISVLSFLIFSIASYSNAISNNLSKSVFRLHVIANSDSDEDQALKYKVRDALISYMNSLSFDMNSKDEVIKVAFDNLDNFKMVAENIISDNGFDYPVDVEIGNFNFPTKVYGDISLPSGYYDALRVKIGNSSGKNWWCVMFPPLCFVDVTSGVVPEDSKENLKENLSEEDFNIVSKDDSISNFKFKIVELFNNIAVKVANK